MPKEDKSQNWFLLAALEDDFGTVLKFQRKKDTCDAAEDKVIQVNTQARDNQYVFVKYQ